jgi:hypothetical protein
MNMLENANIAAAGEVSSVALEGPVSDPRARRRQECRNVRPCPPSPFVLPPAGRVSGMS